MSEALFPPMTVPWGSLCSLLQHKVTEEPLPGTETSRLKELGDLKALRGSWTEDIHEPRVQLGWISGNGLTSSRCLHPKNVALKLQVRGRGCGSVGRVPSTQEALGSIQGINCMSVIPWEVEVGGASI